MYRKSAIDATRERAWQLQFPSVGLLAKD